MGIGAQPGRRPGSGAMSDRGPTPCARGRCLPLIQPFSLVPALLSRALNAALGKRQTRKKHYGICLPLVVSLSLSLTISPFLSLSLYLSLYLLPNSRASRRSADESRDQGGRSEPRANNPLYSYWRSVHVAAPFALLHVYPRST